ncbi:MAG: 1-acyl-sn-glycerol-3-phosphate acyltransferase [Planctomycetes bacterium]|nr:1-acyl-sn-glycerol-3-phosphate acyltransferase [Planctomycetota bacterium]
MRRLAQILFFAAFVRPFLRLFVGMRVKGREHLPASGAFVLIANHSSHLDTVALMSLFPLRDLWRIRPCAASDYFERNKIIKFLSHTFIGILPIDRKHIRRDNHPLKVMGEAMSAGSCLILFPEGTRGEGEEVHDFKPGIAHLIESYPSLTVVPIHLRNFGRALPKGEFVPLPFFCEVRIGPPPQLVGTREEVLATLKASIVDLGDDN